MDACLLEDGNLAGPQEQAALLSYLNGTTTADEAAHEWKKQATDSEKRSAKPTWSRFIDAAEEFPKVHQNLLELLDAIAQSLTTEKGIARNFEYILPHLVLELHGTFKGKSNVFIIFSFWKLTL